MNPESSAGTKRKSEDDPETNSPQASKVPKTFIKHEKHWVEDGSLLLQIGDTRFKVFKSLLTSESTWFAALIEQRDSVFLPEPFSQQKEIDRALATAEEVDGLDLFYLDVDVGEFKNHLTCFSLLLTAMSNAIDYVYSPLKLAEITLLLRAANYYRVQRYKKFCTKFIINLFPDRMPTTDAANYALLVKGVKLARSYDDLSVLLRPAFYGLARSLPPDDDDDSESDNDSNSDSDDNSNSDSDNDTDSDTDDRYGDLNSDDDETVKSDAKKPSPLKKLDSADLVILLDTQKRLVLAWTDIEDLMEYKCNTAQCHKKHFGRIASLRRAMPFDPIRGVHAILSSTNVFTTYCAESTKKVKELLSEEQSKIWEDIKQWIGPCEDEDDP